MDELDEAKAMVNNVMDNSSSDTELEFDIATSETEVGFDAATRDFTTADMNATTRGTETSLFKRLKTGTHQLYSAYAAPTNRKPKNVGRHCSDFSGQHKRSLHVCWPRS